MIKGFQERRRTVVVDFSRGSIKMALAETACEAVRFRGITTILAPRDEESDEIRDPNWIAERIKEEVRNKGWIGMRCACLLSRAATSTQSFQFPAMPEAEMREAIELKLEETLHFELAEACFDFRHIREFEKDGNKQVLTLVAAARKDAVANALEVLRGAGLVPVAIGAAAESLATLAYFTNICDAETTVHVDMGSDSTILNLFEGDCLRFSREIDIAGEAITQAFMRPIITEGGAVHLTYDQAEEVKKVAGCPKDGEDNELPYGLRSSMIRPLIEPVLQRLAGEVRRSSHYLCSLLKRSKVDRIVLSGPSGQMKNLDTWLADNLDTPVTYTDPVARAIAHWRLAICDHAPSSPAGFAAILGYSLGSQCPINLMPRRERLQQNLQRGVHTVRWVTPIAAAIALCLATFAVPIHRRFGKAGNEFVDTLALQQQRLATNQEGSAQENEARSTLARVAQARGVVPDWTGLMKELGAILPEGVQLTTIGVSQAPAGPVVELSGVIPPGTDFGQSLSDLTAALATSPFFHKARILRADTSTRSSAGDFEAVLEIAGSLPLPWEEQP
jgi:type IV pilus assembly protein PilM